MLTKVNYKYHIPTIVRSARGISSKIGDILIEYGAKKVLLVTDKGIEQAGILEKIVASLHRNNISYSLYNEVEPNPSMESIMNGLKKRQELASDHILAIGGGSSIDTAKGIAIMANNEGNILDFEGVGKIPDPGLPLIAIPTTAGTGSEVTASTIVTNKETKFKAAVISPYLYPKLALLDVELTLMLPAHITAATGMDALTHAIESFTSKQASPISRALALEAIRMIGRNIRDAYYVGTNIKSREAILTASMMAGAAFAQSRLGNVHAISHTLGGVFDIAHGIANATLLPFVMKYNLPACPEAMKDIAEALGEDIHSLSIQQSAERAITAVRKLNQDLHIPDNIKDLGVTLDLLPKLVKDSMRSGNILVNPRLTTAKDIEEIIMNAFHGVN